MNQKKKKKKRNIFHVIINANLIVENLIQIKSGTNAFVDVSVKLQ